MAARKPLSKKIRFEVFKRDSFKCQYCGKSAPEAVLHVDHIDPVSKGGSNEIINLITSCVDCNAGKSDRTLDDQSILAKQRDQLAELNERREQLEMMMEWRQGMVDLTTSAVEGAANHWSNLLDGAYYLNETGLATLRKHIRKFGAALVMEAMEIATDQYLRYDEQQNLTRDSVALAFQKVGGIAALKSKPQDERDLYYARGIIRKRLSYCNEQIAMNLLRRARDAGVDSETLFSIARGVRNWTTWEDEMFAVIKEFENGSDP